MRALQPAVIHSVCWLPQWQHRQYSRLSGNRLPLSACLSFTHTLYPSYYCCCRLPVNHLFNQQEQTHSDGSLGKESIKLIFFLISLQANKMNDTSTKPPVNIKMGSQGRILISISNPTKLPIFTAMGSCWILFIVQYLSAFMFGQWAAHVSIGVLPCSSILYNYTDFLNSSTIADKINPVRLNIILAAQSWSIILPASLSLTCKLASHQPDVSLLIGMQNSTCYHTGIRSFHYATDSCKSQNNKMYWLI